MPVIYEWDVEQIEDEDIVDHYFCDSLDEAREVVANGDSSMKWAVVLVCKVEDNRGRTHTSWAYLNEDGTLPESFSDAYNRPTRKVPKKFHDETA
jgi:hypothetical protein